MTELTEEQFAKKASKIKMELSEADARYFTENLIRSMAQSWSKILISGSNVNIKREVKEELKYQLLRAKEREFEKLNGFTYCNKRHKHVTLRKSKELVYS